MSHRTNIPRDARLPLAYGPRASDHRVVIRFSFSCERAMARLTLLLLTLLAALVATSAAQEDMFKYANRIPKCGVSASSDTRPWNFSLLTQSHLLR